ncbi:hypothetical protein HanPI659440_Chr08g0293691 [Helianthus annuus]|nr:hypothetical protein HanPI659440_Chr08g0293691 [Helianthus annuus]
MNISACILILIVVWLCPYQINKWNYDFCLCYRYCDTSALPGWGVTAMVSEQRLFPVENLKIVIKTCEEWVDIYRIQLDLLFGITPMSILIDASSSSAT